MRSLIIFMKCKGRKKEKREHRCAHREVFMGTENISHVRSVRAPRRFILPHPTEAKKEISVKSWNFSSSLPLIQPCLHNDDNKCLASRHEYYSPAAKNDDNENID